MGLVIHPTSLNDGNSLIANMKSLLLTLTLTSQLYLHGQSNPVIIELFTSQGCSSCPAADKNLTELLNKSALEGTNVYGLSFHVDYWNYIGWKDPYSTKAFTERQRNYAEVMKLQSIYTPQMIVNGRDEFVGSNKNKAEEAIKNALSKKPVYVISVDQFSIEGDRLKLNYSIDSEPGTEVINLAVVERTVENYVPRGENQGKKLHHDNVVVGFKTVPLKKQGEMEMTIPELHPGKGSLVIYIQNKQLQILSAFAKAL
jgi:hypothetical protein